MKWNPSKKDIRRFTCGDCHIFAGRLARVTGWELATFRDNVGDPIAHAFCLAPGDICVDVEGFTPLWEFCQRWGYTEIRCWTWRELRSKHRNNGDWGNQTFGRYSFSRARQLVPRLLAVAPAQLR